MKVTQIVIGAVAVLVLAGGGFLAGVTVGRNASAPASASAASSASAQAQARRGGAAIGAAGGAIATLGQPTAGRVISVNDGSITIETRQGGGQGASPVIGSAIVLVGANTRLVRNVEQEIKVSDLKANDQVTILGTTDASGTVSATAIVVGGSAFQQLFGGQGGAGGARPSASPSPKP